MPRIDPAEEDYKLRIASLLALFRTATGESQAAIEERMELPTGKFGRWERGEYPPKAHELAGVHRAFRSWGLETKWLLSPPDMEGLKAVREKLIALLLSGATAASEAEAREAERRLRAGARLASVRGRRSA